MSQQTIETIAKLKNSNSTIGGMASSNGKPGAPLDSGQEGKEIKKMPTLP